MVTEQYIVPIDNHTLMKEKSELRSLSIDLWHYT